MKAPNILLLAIGVLALAMVAWVKIDSESRIARLEAALADDHASMGRKGSAGNSGEAERWQADAAARRIAELEAKVDALASTLGSVNEKLRTLGKKEGIRSSRVSAVVSPGMTIPFAAPSEIPRNIRAEPDANRSWGPEQAVGPPNTDSYGDLSSAWAPALQNGGEEWLELNYDDAVEISEIEVFETYNPGAISKVVALDGNGIETVIWEGQMESGSPVVSESVFQAPEGLTTDRIKVYLDTTRVDGWNEIDAVKLKGKNGAEQWASDSTSSTSFGAQSEDMVSSDSIVSGVDLLNVGGTVPPVDR